MRLVCLVQSCGERVGKIEGEDVGMVRFAVVVRNMYLQIVKLCMMSLCLSVSQMLVKRN
jgi:hypothetical protein